MDKKAKRVKEWQSRLATENSRAKAGGVPWSCRGTPTDDFYLV
jgi:hypothetical protein